MRSRQRGASGGRRGSSCRAAGLTRRRLCRAGGRSSRKRLIGCQSAGPPPLHLVLFGSRQLDGMRLTRRRAVGRAMLHPPQRRGPALTPALTLAVGSSTLPSPRRLKVTCGSRKEGKPVDPMRTPACLAGRAARQTCLRRTAAERRRVVWAGPPRAGGCRAAYRVMRSSPRELTMSSAAPTGGTGGTGAYHLGLQSSLHVLLVSGSVPAGGTADRGTGLAGGTLLQRTSSGVGRASLEGGRARARRGRRRGRASACG